MYSQRVPGSAEAPVVAQLHLHKWGYVERLVEAITFVVHGPQVLMFAHHITMLFVPRGVINLGDNVVDRVHVFIEAIIETHRIKTVTEVSQVRKQAHWSARAITGLLFHQVQHRLFQRTVTIAQVIAAAEPRQIGSRR